MLASFRRGEVPATAAETLGLGRTRFDELQGDYLRAAAPQRQNTWVPGASGGDHAPDWPAGVEPLLRRLLSVKPPAPYRLAASEVHRRLGVAPDPATVRRWAIAPHLAQGTPGPRPPASWRRWQGLKVGALWPLDATPPRWFPGAPQNYPRLDLLDDCSRVCPGAKIYPADERLAYFDFRPPAFLEHGLPLQLYVDGHSLFFPHPPEALTQLGAALHFQGVSFRYALTPQAKGKIQRQHQYWQGRLPALFAAEAITRPEAAQALLPALRRHRHAHEVHRELGGMPNAAAQAAQREGRTVLRPAPRCPWWPCIWGVRTPLKVGPDGRVPLGLQRLRVGVCPGTRVIHCQHPNGAIPILAHEPQTGERPAPLLHLHCP